jgi:hypothetical protein
MGMAPLSKKATMDNSDENDGSESGETPDSAAHYIATITNELAKIARRNGLDSLSYILEMARIEADQIAKG